MQKYLLISIIITGFLFVNQPVSIGQKKIELNEIIIESSKENSAREREMEALEDIAILSRIEVKHAGSRGAGEILKRLPGIIVQGPPMAYRNAKINGLDKEYQSIMVDGHRPAGGEDRRDFKLDRLPANLLEGVEVIYNPSVIYGGSAPAGIINMISMGVPDKRILGVDIGLDNSNTYPGLYPEGSLYYGDVKNDLGYLLYLGRSAYKRNDNVRLEDSKTGISGLQEEISSVTLSSALARFAYTINDNNNLKIKVYWSDQTQREDILADVKRRTQGGLSVRQDSSAETSNLRLLMTEISHEVRMSKWKGVSNVTYDWSWMAKEKTRLRETDPDWELSRELEGQLLHLIASRSDWSSDIFSTGKIQHRIKTGASWSLNYRDFDRMAYIKISDHRFWDEFEDGSYNLNENLFASYFLDEIKFKKNAISPGVRIENHHRNYSTTDTTGNVKYWSFLPSIHGKHQNISGNWTFRWSISRQNAMQPFLYMVPVLKVKHKKEIIEMGNPDLLPGRSWNYQIKLERSFSKNSYINVRGLYTDIRDVVEMKYLGVDDRFHYRTFQPMNIDTAKVYSASIELMSDFYDFTKTHLRLWGNFTWNSSRVRDPGTLQNRRINDQPQFISSINSDYLIQSISTRISMGYTWASRRYTAETVDPFGSVTPGFYYDSFGQLDCSIKYYFTRWGAFSFSVHNLLAAEQSLYEGVVIEETIPGRLFRMGLSLIF